MTFSTGIAPPQSWPTPPGTPRPFPGWVWVWSVPPMLPRIDGRAPCRWFSGLNQFAALCGTRRVKLLDPGKKHSVPLAWRLMGQAFSSSSCAVCLLLHLAPPQLKLEPLLAQFFCVQSFVCFLDCACVRIYTYVCVYMYICIHTYVNMCVCVCICVLRLCAVLFYVRK